MSLINLTRRWEISLPFLHAETEMKTYRVSDPYSCGHRFYRDEVLCLWGITQEEVVHTWSWEETSQYNTERLQAESKIRLRQHEDQVRHDRL